MCLLSFIIFSFYKRQYYKSFLGLVHHWSLTDIVSRGKILPAAGASLVISVIPVIIPIVWSILFPATDIEADERFKASEISVLVTANLFPQNCCFMTMLNHSDQEFLLDSHTSLLDYNMSSDYPFTYINRA